MRKSKFTEPQILAILGEGGAGLPVAQVCRKHGISKVTYYVWKSKYAGMSVNEIRRTKELEAENARLKRMHTELALENAAIKDVPVAKIVTPLAKCAAVPSAASDPARIVGARQGFMLGIAVSALCAIGLTVLLIALPMLAINWTLLLPVSIAVQWWACWRRPSYHHKRALIGYVLGCALAYGVAAAVLMYMFVRALAAITG